VEYISLCINILKIIRQKFGSYKYYTYLCYVEFKHLKIMQVTQKEYNQLLYGSSLLIEKKISTGKKVIVTCKGLGRFKKFIELKFKKI